MRNFYIVLCFLPLVAATDSELNECTTPDNEAGECKLGTECETIPFLKNSRKTKEQWDYMRNASCQLFKGTIPFLCCPLASPSAVPSTGQRTSPVTPAPASGVVGECPPTALPPQANGKCCGVAEFTPRVGGGSETAINEYPWLVLLEYRDIDAGFLDTKCGGSLISGRYVLTAAQCVDSNRTNLPESVRLGEYDTLSNVDCVAEDESNQFTTCNLGSVSIPIESIIRHQQFKPGQHPKNDIALLRLSKMASFNQFVSPICLPSVDTAIPHNLYVAGWGATATERRSSIKMHAMVPYVNLTTCNPFYHNQLRQSQICAGGEFGVDACKGDSGGALMGYVRRYYAIFGIVSYGSQPCGEYAGVYTNVMEYLEWIRTNMHE